MKQERCKSLFNNTITAGINQIVAIVCAFILPRHMLTSYGSEMNGLVSSISQFLSFVSLLDMGVSTVVQTSLYKPLAENDELLCNKILSASSRFFKIIAVILVGYTIVLIAVYPAFVETGSGSMTTALLILAISFSSISEYLFGINNQVLLNADQNSYIQFGFRIITTLFNTIICIFLMKIGASIVFVKIASSLVFLIRPIGMSLYVKKNYSINFKEKYDQDPIEQKWNGLAHHLSSFVFGNTDIVILTMFSTLQDVSIYSVYLLVVSGLNRLYSVCLTGVGSVLGDMYARHESEKLEKVFSLAEWLSHNLVIFMFANTGLLLTDFVMTYTKNISDANYFQPLFSSLLTVAYGLCCLRNVYNILICSAGHFKQTQISSITEAIINIIVSVVLVMRHGLVGVAIGTLVAVFYQQIYYFIYLHSNIVFESYRTIIKQVFVDILVIVIFVLLGKYIHISIYSYKDFFFEMIKSVAITIPILIAVNIIFYKSKIRLIVEILRKGHN